MIPDWAVWLTIGAAAVALCITIYSRPDERNDW